MVSESVLRCLPLWRIPKALVSIWKASEIIFDSCSIVFVIGIFIEMDFLRGMFILIRTSDIINIYS